MNPENKKQNKGVKATKLLPKDIKQLEDLHKRIEKNSEYCLGYPISTDFDFSQLNTFLQFSINNVGDPFEDGTYKAITHDIEKEVVGFFAKMFRADPNDYWGYVTNGGSESNLYGLYLAREMYPNAMVYYSDSTHYSVKKNIHLLNVQSIVIRSQENGEIDYEDLESTIKINRHKPAIILATYGTTMKEAKDDVSKIKKILEDSAIYDHYIHCDAALAGPFGAFVEPRVPFDLKDGADSVSISGHKFIGVPMPCGVIISKKSNRDRISRGVSYIGSLDTTITGSRNGHSPLYLWYALKLLGEEGLKARYTYCLETARYCKYQLNNLGIEAWSNQGALTVVFPRVPKVVREKWQIATQGEVSHIICMPNITKNHIDEFILDLKNASPDVVENEFNHSF